MATMAALAGRTRRLRFGMNVVSLALRDPVLLAKQCATIDVLSEGRLLPAFGIGSPLGPEWQALDIDTKTRGKRTDEALEIIARLWREDSVDFAGKHYRLTGASISPRPVQPDLPMWIGGSSDAAIRRTASTAPAGRAAARRWRTQAGSWPRARDQEPDLPRRDCRYEHRARGLMGGIQGLGRARRKRLVQADPDRGVGIEQQRLHRLNRRGPCPNPDRPAR